MKRLLRSLLVLVLFSAVASAQLRYEIGAGGGLSVSSFPKDIKDFYSSGFGGGLQGELMFTRNLGMRLNVDYLAFPSNKDKLKDASVAAAAAEGHVINGSLLDIKGLNISILGVTMNAVGKIPVTQSLAPYAIAGVGIYAVSVSDASITYQGQNIPGSGTGVPSTTKVGFDVGVGTELTFGVVGLYIEGKYTTILTENNNTNHFPVTLGVFLNL